MPCGPRARLKRAAYNGITGRDTRDARFRTRLRTCPGRHFRVLGSSRNGMAALFGDYEVAKKSGLFDPEYYLATYPDVAERNVDPLVHYLEEGSREGRNPHRDFDSGFYLEQCNERGEAPENPLLHYIRIGAARGFKTRPDATDLASFRAAGSAPDTPGKRPILVAVETLGVSGAPGGRSRLSIGGWALAAAPILEIAVALDGKVVGKANYGQARP